MQKTITELKGHTGKLIIQFLPESELDPEYVLSGHTHIVTDESIGILHGSISGVIIDLHSTTGIKLMRDMTMEVKAYEKYIGAPPYLNNEGCVDGFSNHDYWLKDESGYKNLCGFPDVDIGIVLRADKRAEEQLKEMELTIEHEWVHKFRDIRAFLPCDKETEKLYHHDSEFHSDAMHIIMGKKDEGIESLKHMKDLDPSSGEDFRHPSFDDRIYALQNGLYVPSLQNNINKIKELQNENKQFDSWIDFVENKSEKLQLISDIKLR